MTLTELPGPLLVTNVVTNYGYYPETAIWHLLVTEEDLKQPKKQRCGRNVSRSGADYGVSAARLRSADGIKFCSQHAVSDAVEIAVHTIITT